MMYIVVLQLHDTLYPAHRHAVALGKVKHRFTGFEIDVYRDTDEDFDDVDIREFSDEIDQWVIDELIKIGCDSAKSVLALSPEELLKRTELEEETISSVLSILKAEFEE